MYHTVAKISEAEYKDRGSKFIAYTYPCASVKHANSIKDSLWEEHPKATHICWAYRIGDTAEKNRAWDDGEPSGTAGLPILNQIKSADITYTMVLVVRYYGGKKLGSSGLKTAYKTAAKNAIEANKIISQEPQSSATVECSYEQMPHVMNVLKQNKVEIEEQELQTQCHFRISFPKKDLDKMSKKLSKISTFTTC